VRDFCEITVFFFQKNPRIRLFLQSDNFSNKLLFYKKISFTRLVDDLFNVLLTLKFAMKFFEATYLIVFKKLTPYIVDLFFLMIRHHRKHSGNET